MIKSSIEKLSHEIGYDIGHSDDQVQSDLLNGFCKALKTVAVNQQLETQLCYIADKLEPSTFTVLKNLVAFDPKDSKI